MKKSKINILIMIFIIIISSFSIVNAAKNNNPMLKDIKIDGNTIEPKFEMFTTEYIVTVDENIEQIEIEAIPDDANAKVEMKGNTNLKIGRNEIEIRVTAEDGKAIQSYFLYITRGKNKETNANLKELNVKDCELAPNFNKDTINYAFEYPEDLEKVEITAETEDENAKVEIIGNENLVQVVQNIEVKVTASDGQTIKTYYLTAKKAGIPVESPEGREPTKQEEQIQKTNEEKKPIIIFYIIGIIAITIIIVILKMIIDRRKGKDEK